MFDEIKKIQSSDQNVMKFVFSKEETSEKKGAVAEAVLYKYPTYKDRTVICCSTQSGCPVGCRFCGAGDFFIRNLTTDEIVEQVEECFDEVYGQEHTQAQDIDKCQIMFMSMGEPMLNWKNLKPALRRLHVMYPRAALLISTMGPDIGSDRWTELYKLAEEIPTIGLQFSVHEAMEEDRNNLIPMKKKLSLSEITTEGITFYAHTGRRPYFNYCVHESNNSQSHVDRLYSLFGVRVWEATISVICERDEGVKAANIRQRSLASEFMEKMLLKGYSTRMFDPAGQDDIGGGCGQLHYAQSWAKEHEHLLKDTHGTGKVKVHTPKVEPL